MEENKDKNTFYKRCPCGTVSGFCLDAKTVVKDLRYFCHVCKKSIKLSEWGDSDRDEYSRSGSK